MASTVDLLDLSRQLKQERLFVNCERDQLHQLNNEVHKVMVCFVTELVLRLGQVSIFWPTEYFTVIYF